MPIHHEVDLHASTERVFAALTSAEQFSAFTDETAEIDAIVGGQFRCFSGMITGVNVELVPNERIVQAWRVENWDPGVYSLVRFELQEIGESQTRIIFDHAGYPEEHHNHLEPGWHNKYWQPLRKYLEA